MEHKKGLSTAQVERVLEDFQRLALVFKTMNTHNNQLPHKDLVFEDLICLAKEESDSIHRDIKGMLDGNLNKGGKDELDQEHS